ncbi:hypothetical protein A1O3_02596 [Capronia epimyces CBS 606.96]|uniref:Methyltransferase type 11 domain-containing protein n=1 Tax=Capronia epimyces CBS 606.96 TaxID=1182542 RepID=W9Z4W1_9EURO|nr:uncharacterized protein A1O3_02596 [Capronia epimyces CBS 606.96]EXJ89529.1 hypothetical protein A1O3_02596 [Capronia epimyces CBS 606.96]
MPTDSAEESRIKQVVVMNREEGYDPHPGTKSQTPPPRSGKFSRLGIFGRRGKSPAPEPEVTPRKLQRKGPTAGTGHEGYGRRIALFSSKSSKSRSSSRQTRSSQSDLDDFAATRLRPVPIVGGSRAINSAGPGDGLDVYDNAPPSSSGSDKRRPLSQSQGSFGQNSGQDGLGGTGDPALSHRTVPTLAFRRSQRLGNDEEKFSLPMSIRTHELLTPLYISSQEESRSSALLGSLSTPSTTTDLYRSDNSFYKSKDKRNWKRKWNIFRRKGSEQEPEQTAHLPSSSPDELPVSILAISTPRPMPYYAMIDSESEMNTTEQLPDLLPQLTESPAVSPINEGYEAETSYNAHTAEAYEDDILLPSASLSLPQSFDRSLPSVPLQSPKQRVQGQIEERPQRQPRLARVGRIPAVVPRNEEQSQPSRALFLKPLVRESTAENVYNLRNTPAAGFRAPLETRTHLQPGRLLPSVDRAIPSNADTLAKSEFLRFPSGAASEASTSSSSEGPLSMLGPLPGSSPPKEGHPARFAHDIDINASNSPSVDEVWNEYDDFLDHVMSPSLARKDTSSTLREKIPFPEQAERHLTASVRNAVKPQTGEPYIVFPDLSIPAMERPVFGQGTAASTASPVIFPSAMLEQTAGEDVRLRRSRIVSALHSSTDPTSPFSIRDLLNEYDSHHRSSTIPSERLSTSSASQSLKRWTATMSRPEMHKESNHQEHVALLDVVERKKDPAAQSELQFASLMVAKWLSFGRVLFSPAHDEIQTLRERHVLVIDGLGTEDWSIYCAVTYEAQQAFVHHLQEKPSGPGLKSFKASQNAPNNHRRAQVTSFDERFPFPPAFFSAVVLRFPPAMPEAKMKNIISECRRVLLPGGYLELLLLDLDIVNMGVQTRRAVRELKFRLATADTQISLRPIIDNVQSVLSARGFSSISRCVVGVPVAGRPTGSAASSSSSRSSGGSDSLPKGGAGSPRPATASPRMTFGLGRKGANLSLNDLIADHSENADAKIGRIVSRTARAWWQHCFEASVIPDGDLSRSIFAEKNLLRECRSRGSSFKMLIAHAQRPVFESRRRTMSEPLVQTLATAGAQRRTQQSSHESHTA